jgi:adenylate cyclase
LLLHWLQNLCQGRQLTTSPSRLRAFRQRLRDLLDAYTPSYFPIAWKMGLTISLLVLVGMTLLGSVLVNRQVASMQSQANTFGEAIANQLADSAREPLLAQDTFTLKILVNNLTRGNGLEGAAIFDPRGRMLQQAGNMPAQLTTPATQPRLVWQRGQDSFTTYTMPVTVKDLTAGYVAISLSQQAIIEAQQQVQHTIFMATLLLSLLIIAAAFLVGRWMARPLQDLVAATQAINTGNLHFRLSERRNDELGQLIDSYNKMASGLLEKDQVENVLSRFVSPGVARKMMQDIEQVELGGRETQATVLFADIAGFTRLAEKLTPDEVARLLNDYFNAISCAARFYRGTIDKYVGDCAMIVFGVPEEDSEHLYHGLCCALMTQRLIARLNQWRQAHGQVTVSFRIGINSGQVLAGNLGSNERMQYTVVGDTVNLASRLSNLAQAGEIILPLQLLGNSDIASRFRFNASDEIRVRGKARAVSTARLDGMHAQLEVLMEQRIQQFMNQLEPPSPPKEVRLS